MADRKDVERFVRDLDMYFEVRTDYSGRGMYGDTCASVTLNHDETSLGDIFQAVFDLGSELGAVEDPNEEDTKLANTYGSFLRSALTDGMGTGTAIYFPAANTTGWRQDNEDEN